jgi:hypothetical protein
MKGRTILIAGSENQKETYKYLKEAFEEEWNLCDSIVLTDIGRATNLLYSKPNVYLLVQLKTYSLSSSLSTLESDYGASTYGVGSIDQLIFKTENKAICIMSLPTTYTLSKAMFIETLRRGLFLYNEVEKESTPLKTMKQLKSKYFNELEGRTLLIPEEYFSSEKDLQLFKKSFSFPVQSIKNEELLELITEKDTNYAYLVIAGKTVVHNTRYICLPESGKIVSHHDARSILANQNLQKDIETKRHLNEKDIKLILGNYNASKK